MPSLQARLMRFSFQFTRRMLQKPVPEIRRQMNLVERYMWVPPGVDILPAKAGSVPVEWTKLKRGAANAGVLFYMHGGGFVMGSPRSHRLLVAHLARLSGVKALSVDYSLAPEHPFPAGLEDALEAYRWLLGSGVSPDKIVLGGDSAGGNLVLASLLALRDNGEPLPAGAVCLSPATDLTGSVDSQRSLAGRDPLLPPEVSTWMDMYSAGADRSQPLLSPLWGDLYGLPPLLLHVGTDEFLRDDSVLFAEKARQAGVNVELKVFQDMWHVFHMGLNLVPESHHALNEVAGFIRRQIS